MEIIIESCLGKNSYRKEHVSVETLEELEKLIDEYTPDIFTALWVSFYVNGEEICVAFNDGDVCKTMFYEGVALTLLQV